MESEADHGRSRRLLAESLKSAINARDSNAVAAFRSAMGAIDNAEAVDGSRAPAPTPGTIGEVHLGVGSGEVARRELSVEDVLDILRSEIRERTEAAAEYSRIGQAEHASRLKAEAAALMSFIEGALGET